MIDRVKVKSCLRHAQDMVMGVMSWLGHGHVIVIAWLYHGHAMIMTLSEHVGQKRIVFMS
jgi:hypothetical protein